MTKVIWDRIEMKRLDRAMHQALKESVEQFGNDIKTLQVVPKQTGALEDSQKIEDMKTFMRLSYSTDYAARLYFHPEYNFHHDVNANAQGRWVEAAVDQVNLAEKYAITIRTKL